MNSMILTLFSLSVSGSLLALVILALKHLLRRKVSKLFLYYIWVVVLLRLILPFSPSINAMDAVFPGAQATAPFQAAMPADAETSESVTGLTSEAEAAVVSFGEQPSSASVSAGQAVWEPLWAFLGRSVIWVWLAGVCVTLICYIVPYFRFTKAVVKTASPASHKQNSMFMGLCKRRRVKLVQSACIHTPVLVGILQPRIIIPSQACAQHDEMLSHILSHELIHYRRKDLLFKWMIVFISALHWFNPLMLLIRREISRACELSCDEAAIKGMSAEQRRQYGETLLALAGDGRISAGILATTMCEDKKKLAERLVGIKKTNKRTVATVALSVAMALFLTASAAMLGSCQQNKAAVLPPPAEIETIAGSAPIDLADNEISHAYLPYLVKEAKRISPYLEITDPGLYEQPYKVFAAVPFKDGALLLAGTAVSEDYPVLYYMVGENVIAVNDDAEYFSSNYTVFQGCTIVYGRMVGVYTEDPYVYATGVKATFANGQETEAQSFVSNKLPDTAGGYILAADGETWLSGLNFYRPDGTLLTDMTRTDEYGWDQDVWLYRGTAAEIFNLQHRTQFTTWPETARSYIATLDNGMSAPLSAFYDDGTDLSYLWRNNNILHHMRDSAPGVPLTVASYPDIITELDYPERSDGVPLPDSAKVYWFNLSNEDGTRKDFNALLKPGKLVTPDETGPYLLVIDEGGWRYVQVICVT